jgi:serine/threonine-protein kinase
MSEVYAAEHPTYGIVALKLLRGGVGAEDQGFVAEAARTRAVRHRNVVEVFEAGRDDATGCCYLVMERVEGEDLATRLRRLNRLDEASARALFAAIADGMAAAHACGIVHRDLKPANVMLAPGDEPKIVDFGIARYLGTESALSTSSRIGTPAYMAPEQLTGGLIAPCVDVWAIGVILFEAVTGRLPFDGFADGRCPQLFETAPRTGAAISPALERLIARCLDKDPGRRPASMAEIAGELRAEVTAEPERITQDVAPAPTSWPASTAPPPALTSGRAAASVASQPLRTSPLGLASAGLTTRPARDRRWLAIGVLVGAVVLGVGGAFAVGSRAASPASEPASSVASPIVPAALATPALPPPSAVSRAIVMPADATPPVTTPPATTPPIATPAAVAPLDIDLRSKPAGAQIVIDGKAHGVTPAHLALAGPTSIVVRRAGYRSSRVRADRAGRIDVRLVPLPPRHVHEKGETLD